MIATLSGCSVFSRQGTPSLRVDVPPTCERLPGKVKIPKVRGGQDARVVIANHRRALVLEHKNIDNKDTCMKQQREEYGSAGS